MSIERLRHRRESLMIAPARFAEHEPRGVGERATAVAFPGSGAGTVDSLADNLPQPSRPHAIAVRRYGLLHPQNWTPDCEAEMAGATRLWNRLVEIDRLNRDDYRRVAASPELDAAQAALDAAMTHRDALLERRAQMRKTARARIKTPELDAEISAARQAIAPLIDQAKTLRRAARDANRAALAVIEEKRKAAVKLAYQQSGLYWSNYNAVIASYERARAAALKGGAELHEHNRNADRITNQHLAPRRLGALRPRRRPGA